jgi:hypothetical protein
MKMSRADCNPWLAKMTGGGVKIAIFGQSRLFKNIIYLNIQKF